MSPHFEWLFIFSTALMVAFRALTFKRLFWDRPLNHGHGFFLGVEVSPGFYEGEGVRWLRRYHRAWLIELSMEALILVGVIISAPWLLLPWWVLLPGALLCTSLLGAVTGSVFAAYTRATLGANPPVRPSIAVPLEARRLSDYISWPREALIAVITASIWALLLIHRHGQLVWHAPFLMTYAAVGLFSVKIDIVRHSSPLPADRPEEHYHWMEATRRQALYGVDALRWCFLFTLVDYALIRTWHAWRFVGPGAWLRWSVMGSAWTVGVFFILFGFREQQRLAAMGRSLRPLGSWSTPFRPAKPMIDLAPWSAAWFGGLVLLLVFFRR